MAAACSRDDKPAAALPTGAVEGFMLFVDLCAPGHEHHLIDQPVRLCGLTGRADLNGKVGTTVSFEATEYRFGVEVDGARINVRPQCLQMNWRKGDPIPKKEGQSGAGSREKAHGSAGSSGQSVLPKCEGSAPAQDTAPAAREYVSLAEQLAMADLMDAEERGEGASEAPEGGKPSARRRRKKRNGNSEESIDAMGAHVETLSRAQASIKEAYAEFETLQQRLAALEKLTPNNHKGEVMLWKKKKAISDEMLSKLDRVRALCDTHKGAGNVPELEALKAGLAEQVASAAVVR
jgi:hypothetical protein